MKKSKAETAKTRQKIVAVAAETIRNQGIEATGVAEIMAAAGLTHGGFYRHFDSKEQLVSEAIASTRKDFVDGTLEAATRGADALLRHFQDYATAAHRDDLGHGCCLAANGSELVRAGAQTRHLATAGFRTIVETAAPFMRATAGQDQTEVAVSVLTNMIGALTMSRMVDDPALSEKILDVTRQRIAAAFDLSTPAPRRHASAATA